MQLSVSDWLVFYIHNKCGYYGTNIEYVFGYEPCPKCGEVSGNHIGWTKRIGRRVHHIFTSEVEWKPL